MDLSASSIISTTGMTLINSGNLDPIASERWNVEKKRLEIDAEIEDFYNSQISKSINIENISNKKAMKLYNDIFYKVKWAVPPIPTVHGRLIIGYCGHLLNVGSKTPYPNELDMMVWLKKSKGTKLEKVTAEVHGMCNRMFKIIDKRDSLINKTQSTLLSVTEKMNIKKDGTLRFMMENNHNSRDEYFSLWFLAIHNKHRELEVLLNSTTKLAQYAQGIDTLDPDFQLSALHYAIKHNHPLIITLLLKYNANILLRAPDGRTVLHYAAAYSTREVVLDLLSRGIDYTATDHYNCIALDLARQNANKLTIPVLTNWTSLVPSEQPGDVFYLHNNINNNNNSMNFVSNINGISMLEDSDNGAEHGLTTTVKLNNPNSTMNASDNRFATTAAFQTTNQDPNLSYYSHLNENSNYQFLLQTGPSLDSSMLVHVPDEYSVTPQDTISRMSPMLRLLTKRLEACNKYNPQVDNIDSSEARSRRPESSSYFLSRSVTSINHIANSMSHSMSLLHSQSHDSIGIGFTQQSELQFEHSSEVQGAATAATSKDIGEGLLVKSVTFESPLNAESTAEVQSGVLEINVSDHSVQSVPYDINSAQYNSSLFQTNNRVNAAEQNRATLALIENEVNECQVEIRQCSKHYHLCVQEGFLTEALRSLKRRWLVAKELLVLHQRRQECLQLEWEDRNTFILCNDDTSLAGSDRNDFREQSIGLGDNNITQNLPFGIQTTSTYHRSGIDDVLAQVKEQQFGYTAGVSGTGTAESKGVGNNDWEDDLSASIMVIDDDASSVNQVNDLNLATLALTETMNQFIVATDEEESVLNLTANAKEERIDLDRLALNFHKSLKRVMYVPDLTAAPSDTHHLQDNSLISTAGEGQYFLAENSMESDKLLLPAELDAGVSGSSADYSSSSGNNIDNKQSKVMYIGSEYEKAGQQQDSKPPLASYVAPDTNADMSMSADHREQIASNLSKDVLQFNSNSNIYYEAAQYVSAVKTEQHVTALDIILSINDQARKRKIIYRRDDSSTAASTTLPASQKWHREDALSISTRDDSPSITTLTTAPSTIQFSVNNNNSTATGQSKRNKISVSYLLQLGLELVDVLTARKEEGIAIRVLEECCIFLDGDEIDSTLKIKLIARKCELLQFIYRYLYEQVHRKSSPAMREFEIHRAEEMFLGVQYIPTIEIPAGGVAESMTLSGVGYKQLTDNVLDSSVLAADEQVNNYGSVFSADLPGAGGDSVEQTTQSGHFSSNAANTQQSCTQSHTATHTIPTASMEGFVAMQSQSILSVQHGSDDDASGERPQSSVLAQRQQVDLSNVNNELLHSSNDHNSSTDNTSVVSDHQQLQEPDNHNNVSVEFLDESADNSQLHFASQDTQPQTSQAPTVMEQVLLNIAEVADHSIELHYQLYGSDLFEPYTLSQALQAIAFVQEYSYRGLEALIFMQHAEIIARRALGGAAEETIKVALEALRLFVKYHLYTKEDLRYVDQKSAEINRHITAFSHVNLPLADTFTKKCTELMALATVTILDPHNNTIGSTRGTQGKKRGKVTAFESANKTIRKRYATNNSRTKL